MNAFALENDLDEPIRLDKKWRAPPGCDKHAYWEGGNDLASGTALQSSVAVEGQNLGDVDPSSTACIIVSYNDDEYELLVLMAHSK